MPKRKTEAQNSKHFTRKQDDLSHKAVSPLPLPLWNRDVFPESIPYKSIYYVLSFLFPFVILGTVFALHEVYPFGNRQILIFDFTDQYYPFLSDYWYKLREGKSLLWSWVAGAGIDYLPLMAYYLMSPLNLLTILFPHSWLRESLTLILLMKIGIAGLFFSIYLRYTYKQCDLLMSAFASLYALCAFTLGYYYNIMWFDTFALLPLVILGLQLLVREGKYRLYVISLALAVFTNYAVGYYVCIFVAIMFFGQCFIHRMDWHEFIRKLTLIAVCSIIALGLTALITLPAFSSLQSSGMYTNASSDFFKTLWLLRSFVDILGNIITFSLPAFHDIPLPYLYCGVISVLLASMFAGSSKVTLREKVVLLGTAAFLIISCNSNVLNYMWSGFIFNVGLPFRFSFLFSFLLVIMAFRAYTLIEDMKKRDLMAMGIGAMFFLLMAAIGSQGKQYVIGSAILCVVYLLLFAFVTCAAGKKNAAFKLRILKYVLLAVVLTEVSTNSYIGVKTMNANDIHLRQLVDTRNRNMYPDRYDDMQLLLNMRQPDNTGFYRTELTVPFNKNDNFLYGYDGISFYSSTSSYAIARFMKGLGLFARDHTRVYWYSYNETTPLINAFLNMRYLICRDGNPADNGVFWGIAGESNGMLLLENKRYLPLGFMVNEELTDYSHDENNPFISQNNLFRLATGLDGDLFTIIDATSESHEGLIVHRKALGNYSYALTSRTYGKLVWNYKMPVNGMLYVYNNIDYVHVPIVFANGNGLRIIYNSLLDEFTNPHIFSAGRFTQGDEVSIIGGPVESKEGNAVIYAAYINQDLFDQGYALLADETLNLTKFTETEIVGNVTALKDGLLYISIPYQKHWKAFIDGVQSELLPVGGAMAAVRLSKGPHIIEFRYYNNSLTVGIIVSIISLVAFIALMMLESIKSKNVRHKTV